MPVGREMLKHFETHGSATHKESDQPQMARIGGPKQQADSGESQEALPADIADMRPQTDR